VEVVDAGAAGAAAVAAPVPAGEGVAGGFEVAVDAGLGCGAAGGAGVDVEAEGVEGVAGLAAGVAFGWMDNKDLLRDHALVEHTFETMHTMKPFSL
jgi:hypothetical protein